jgi:N-acetylglutamate synthase-like GNAT family acetyltransferase
MKNKHVLLESCLCDIRPAVIQAQSVSINFKGSSVDNNYSGFIIVERLAGNRFVIVIREATKRDLLKLVEIMNKSAGKKELKGFVPPASETEKFLMKSGQQFEVSGHKVLVAEMDGKAVGFIYCIQEKDRMAIEEVDVVKQYQGRGIGRALVKRAERSAKNKDVKYLTAGTAINSEGKP